jgi:nitrogen fixation protein FixH
MNLLSRRTPREVTGRIVLLWLIGFFGFVFAVNAVMVRAATSTFGGLDTPSSYKAGLMFEGEVAKAKRQEAMHWRVDGNLKHDRKGEAVLDLSVRDAQGALVTGLTADATLKHPADERLDHVIHLSKIGAGTFRGETRGHSGQWELVIDFYRGGERVYRSRSRVSLK